MKKSEVLEWRRKNDIHYPPEMLFDIYGDEDDIPIELVTYYPLPQEREIKLYGSAEFIKKVEEDLEDYINHLKNGNK